MLRTSVLGGTFCTTNGEIFKSGSRVVKSVAGYDIHRAFCGSQGKFGAIVSVTLKVQPKPEMFFRFLASNINREKVLSLAPTVLEPIENNLLVEIAGYHEDIEDDIRQLRDKNIPTKELDEHDWTEALTILRKTQAYHLLAPEAEELLLNVRHVFDPKNILQ
jgi:FAD/FMN-containing dehydrogenase